MVIQDLDNNNDYPMASSGISTIELFPNVDVGGTSISDSSIYTVDGVPGSSSPVLISVDHIRDPLWNIPSLESFGYDHVVHQLSSAVS